MGLQTRSYSLLWRTTSLEFCRTQHEN